MAQLPMPPMMAGSPQTTLTLAINQTDTQLNVANIEAFPDVGSTNNFVTISISKLLFEVCQYTAKVPTTGGAGYLVIVRSGANHYSSAAGNAALPWSVNAKCARNVNKRDFDLIQDNIRDLAAKLQIEPIVASILFGD